MRLVSVFLPVMVTVVGASLELSLEGAVVVVAAVAVETVVVVAVAVAAVWAQTGAAQITAHAAKAVPIYAANRNPLLTDTPQHHPFVAQMGRGEM